MTPIHLFALAALGLVSEHVAAAPAPSAPRIRAVAPGTTIPLVRRGAPSRTAEEWGEWAHSSKVALEAKYGAPAAKSKRGTGTNLITNQQSDSSFFGSIAVGTPPASFNVILDTGSADLWVADTDYGVGTSNISTFSSVASTSFQNLSTNFAITYGSGRASGVLGQDTVQMAGFEVARQAFGVCDSVSTGLLDSPVSGLMGLAWQTIAASGAMPFWQALVSNKAWDEPLMAFQLTRFVNVSSAEKLEPGGQFTMGFTNSSVYTGDIEYSNIPGGQGTYWISQITKMTVNSNSVSVPTDSSSYAAIDTGTTLVGGPPDQIAAIYAQIPGSAPGTGNLEGYWTYPCSTAVTVGMAFGGTTWPISPADFMLATLDRKGQTCLGAFFELQTGGSAPAWIVGDTFLKNVYSVYRFSPPSVGFAALNTKTTSAIANGAVPSQTVGAPAAIVTLVGNDSVSNDGLRIAPAWMATLGLFLAVQWFI